MNEMTADTSVTDAPDDAHRSASFLTRYDGLIRLASIIGIILGIFLIMRTLPVGEGLTRLEGWVESLGPWGPVAFALIYIITTVALIPGGLVTIAAGAIFGLLWGFISVSIGSTIGAAIAFLIGRHVARNTVREQAQAYPKFAAVDRAIGESGWHIIAMLRLVPLFPFNVGNYLLGLTPVRFWHYVLASWIAMMPGTFVYVYLGHIGRKSVEAAAGEGGLHPLQWILIIVGLAIAAVVTIYLTRLAKRKLAQETELDPESDEPSAASDSEAEAAAPSSAKGWKSLGLAGASTLVLVLGACATLNPTWLSGFFGPPTVAMVEAYETRPDGPTVDHTTFDRLMRTYVSTEDGGGWVDYVALKNNDREALQQYIKQVADVDFDALGRDEKLALLINAYNAFTIELILEFWDDEKIISIYRDIPTAKRWDDKRWKVGENVWSLNQIEHQQIRPKFKEPRIHWALVCAAVGCPPLRNEAYTGERLEHQFEDQARIVHTHDRWVRFDREAGEIHLTKLYDWYAGDFEQVDGGALAHAARYLPPLHQAMDEGNRPRIRWIEYDWDLNHREHVK